MNASPQFLQFKSQLAIGGAYVGHRTNAISVFLYFDARASDKRQFDSGWKVGSVVTFQPPFGATSAGR